MTIHLTSATNNQDGFNNGGTWDDTSATMGGTSGRSLGMRFQISGHSLDSESRGIDPLRLVSPMTLTLYTAATVSIESIATLFFVPESAPAAYSDSLLPLTRGDSVGGDGVFRDSLGSAVDTAVTVAAGTAADTAVVWEDIDIYSLLQYTNLAAWNGYICLTASILSFGGLTFHTAEGSDSSFVPSLVAGDIRFHTGVLSGPAVGKRARSRICPKTGVPVSGDEMVRDGYSDGLVVAPWAYDPDDPDERYVPNPNEGVVDDEV